jgi:hypothetical protein
MPDYRSVKPGPPKARPNVQIWPDRLRGLRAMAYRSSREGRDAE